MIAGLQDFVFPLSRPDDPTGLGVRARCEAPSHRRDNHGAEKSKVECEKLINMVRQKRIIFQKKNIADIYKDEYNKNLFKFDRFKYLATYRNSMDPSPRIHFEMDK